MTDYDISLDNYVKGNYSICREERQYALYLCNILRYYGNPDRRKPADQRVKRIFENCGFHTDDEFEKLKIENVFYEVTFMRDFLERSRRINLEGRCKSIEEICLGPGFRPLNYADKNDHSFNKRLIDYVTKYYNDSMGTELCYDPHKIEERNYGHYAIPGFDDGNDPENKKHIDMIKLLIKAMMNAKPDLAVIYSEGEMSKYLLFLECKFESGEDMYSIKQDKKADGYTQRKVQWHIASFLTTNGFLQYGDHNKVLEMSPLMEGEKSGLVTFSRCPQKNCILIEDLISVENACFN